TPGGARSRVYYAKNIRGGAYTVTLNLSGTSRYLEVYLTEYAGVDPVNPIDGEAGASGAAGAVSSGSGTTAGGNIIHGFCMSDGACTVGGGFTARSTYVNNLTEDRTADTPGSYAATGLANNGWSMQLVALKRVQ